MDSSDRCGALPNASRAQGEASGQNVHLKTSAKLAAEYDVDEKTIRRDASRAQEMYDEAAKERQKLSQGAGKKGPANLPDHSEGRNRV